MTTQGVETVREVAARSPFVAPDQQRVVAQLPISSPRVVDHYLKVAEWVAHHLVWGLSRVVGEEQSCGEAAFCHSYPMLVDEVVMGDLASVEQKHRDLKDYLPTVSRGATSVVAEVGVVRVDCLTAPSDSATH